jgi:hypothetical protein
MDFHCKTHSLLDSMLPISTTKECYSTHFLDEFTVVHYVNGIAINIMNDREVLVSAVGFEIIENNPAYINNFYADGIYKGDSLLNSISDILVFYLGVELTKKSSTIKKNKNKSLLGIVGINALMRIIDEKKAKRLNTV